MSRSRLAELLRTRGAVQQAEQEYRQALAILQAGLPEGHFRIALARGGLGGSLVDQGRYDEAEPLLLESHPVLEKERGPQDSNTLRVASDLVALYDGRGEPEKAAPYRALLSEDDE